MNFPFVPRWERGPKVEGAWALLGRPFGHG